MSVFKELLVYIAAVDYFKNNRMRGSCKFCERFI